MTDEEKAALYKRAIEANARVHASNQIYREAVLARGEAYADLVTAGEGPSAIAHRVGGTRAGINNVVNWWRAKTAR